MTEDSEASTQGGQPGGSASADAPASDDPKERYRQALERKKAQGGHQGHGQASSGTSAKGSSSKAGGKREFRRKSG